MNKVFTRLVSVFLLLNTAVLLSAENSESLPVYTAEVVNTYPHDDNAFTQGLLFYEGKLFEGTGRNGQSSIREVDLESGELLRRQNLPPRYFGEGITIMNGKVYQLTWRSHLGFVYDLESFIQEKSFFLAGEGWGITHDGESLIVSDGTAQLRFLDPDTLTEQRRINVTLNGQPVRNLNELEFINGEVWANVWYEDFIIRIDPASGEVNSLINLTGLYPDRRSNDEVLNGIAWDAHTRRLFVTGKLWSSVYEIEIRE